VPVSKATDAPAASLIEALLAAQMEFPDIPKGAEGGGGQRKYRYATLPVVLGAVLPALNKHGLVLIQRTVNGNEHMTLETVLRHTSGEELTSEVPLPIPSDWQDWGSALTYARRYSITALLGVAPDDDDDAESAQGVQSAGWQDNGRREARTAPATPKDMGHGMCPDHNVPYHFTDKMREKNMAPAHPVDGQKEWCRKPRQPDVKVQPSNISEAEQRALDAVKELFPDGESKQIREWMGQAVPAVSAKPVSERTDEDWDAVATAAINTRAALAAGNPDADEVESK
jgi:hypothetical protein